MLSDVCVRRNLSLEQLGWLAVFHGISLDLYKLQ